MNLQKKIMIATLIMGIALFVGILFLVPTSSTTTSEVVGTSNTDSSGGGIVMFIPIFVAAFLPVMLAIRQNQNKDDNVNVMPMRKSKPKDRFAMMQELVDDLDNDELAYLEKRLVETHGDVLEGGAHVS